MVRPPEQPDEGNDDLPDDHANAEQAPHQRVISGGRRMERRYHLRDTAPSLPVNQRLVRKSERTVSAGVMTKASQNVARNQAEESIGRIRAPVGVQHRDQPDEKRRAPGQPHL